MLHRSFAVDGAVADQPVAVEARFTGAVDGDFFVRLDASELDPRRRTVHPEPWVWVRQVHQDGVVVVPDAASVAGLAGSEADAIVTMANQVPLAIHTADCGPVLLVGDGGQLGVAHAGWRGVMAGVLEATVEALRELGAGQIRAVLGPAIGPECYEFGARELDSIVDRLGPEVRSHTAAGSPALDMRAAVGSALIAAGLSSADIEVMDLCTSCDPGFFSHRARVDRGRQALVAWRDVGDS